MTSDASKQSRDANRASLRRQADRAQGLLRERDDLMATIFQARQLLDAGDVEGAKATLTPGEIIEPLPASQLDLIGFSAMFNALCIERKVRAAWFTTTPMDDGRVTITTGGEAHHNRILDTALDDYARSRELAYGERPQVLLTPDEVAKAFPQAAP